MDRRDFIVAGASVALSPLLNPSRAFATPPQVLRLAMTLADIPLTTGQATQGAEGIRFVGRTLYDGLLNLDVGNGTGPSTIVPGLAVSYSIDPTQKVWTFKLRQNVKFHDGSDFDADAVVWNLDKLLNKNSPQFDRAQLAAAASYVINIQSYAKIDAYTVAITTSKPDAMLYYRIWQIGMSSPTRFAQVGGDWNKFAQQPSGTGPFILDKLVPRERAELVKNANYWDQKRVPKLDRVILFTMPDSSTRVAALLSGEVDWVEAPSPDAVPRLQSSGMQIVSHVYPHIWPYFLSLGPDSPFHDIRVRKAANLGIDRNGLVKFLGGLAKPARGMVDVASPWFGKPTFDCTYDAAAATKLLAEAGYGPNKKCAIKLLTSQAGSGQMQPVSMNEFIQESLNQVNFDVTVEVVDWETLRHRRTIGAKASANAGIVGLNNSWSMENPDFGMLSVIETVEAPPVGNNWGFYSDSTADALCEKTRLEFDAGKRNAILAQLHEYVVDQSMWIYVVHDLNPRALAPNVKGFVPPASWFVDLTSVSMA